VYQCTTCKQQPERQLNSTFRPLPYRRDIIVSRRTQARLAVLKYETSIAAFTHVRPSNIRIHENLKTVT